MNILYNLFILYIFLIKILFVLSSCGELYYKWKNNKLEKKNNNQNQSKNNINSNQENQEYKKNKLIIEDLDFWKKRFEFIYIICMSVLLIYLFNPYHNTQKLITGETRYLIFLFAFVLITTSNWGIFIKESPWFIKLKYVIGNINSKQNPNTNPNPIQNK